MSEYTDAVERGLAGMKGVSTGTCPSCVTCMGSASVTLARRPTPRPDRSG